jgi:DNA polymerase V
LAQYGQEIRDLVKQWTGISVSIGIASTKTLAKVANRIAKKSGSSVCHLAQLNVDEV